MYDNLDNINIIQYFADVTYYATQTASKKYKIWSLLGFDIKQRNTKLCTMALVQNEVYETFACIFTELKKHFKFNPQYITYDFNKALIKAIILFSRCYINIMLFSFYTKLT